MVEDSLHKKSYKNIKKHQNNNEREKPNVGEIPKCLFKKRACLIVLNFMENSLLAGLNLHSFHH